jgi:hypothetical protein
MVEGVESSPLGISLLERKAHAQAAARWALLERQGQQSSGSDSQHCSAIFPGITTMSPDAMRSALEQPVQEAFLLEKKMEEDEGIGGNGTSGVGVFTLAATPYRAGAGGALTERDSDDEGDEESPAPRGAGMAIEVCDPTPTKTAETTAQLVHALATTPGPASDCGSSHAHTPIEVLNQLIRKRSSGCKGEINSNSGSKGVSARGRAGSNEAAGAELSLGAVCGHVAVLLISLLCLVWHMVQCLGQRVLLNKTPNSSPQKK